MSAESGERRGRYRLPPVSAWEADNGVRFTPWVRAHYAAGQRLFSTAEAAAELGVQPSALEAAMQSLGIGPVRVDGRRYWVTGQLTRARGVIERWRREAVARARGAGGPTPRSRPAERGPLRAPTAAE